MHITVCKSRNLYVGQYTANVCVCDMLSWGAKRFPCCICKIIHAMISIMNQNRSMMITNQIFLQI